jgi:hypothetical protein
VLKRLISIGVLLIISMALFGCNGQTTSQNNPVPESSLKSQTASLNTPVPKSSFRLLLPFYSNGGDTKATFKLESQDIPDIESIMVYKAKKPVVNTESVKKSGAKLGFNGGTGLIDQDTKYAMLNETSDKVEQYCVWINSGAVEYAILSPDKLSPGEPPALPSKEDAIKIATNFLTKTGLMPDTALGRESVIASAVSGGTYNQTKKSKSGSGPVEIINSYDSHILVNFSRQINGIPVADSGGNKLGVRIGDKGEVFRVLKVWREVEPYQEYPVKSAQQAYNELVAGKGSSSIPPKCSEIIIDRVSLAYWMETLDVSQEYVLPVYEFTGTCRAANGDVLGNYLGRTQALE